MARSSANFISYDLRPAKQSERRILLDLLKITGDSGLAISDYRYVGMGANRFYDFLLFHKYLGISKMVSLEHDESMFPRAKFNNPYKFINVLNKSSGEFIDSDEFTEPSILWLDYDGGLSPSMVQDISALSTKLKLGDFCFVTVFGGPPRHLERVNSVDRLAWFKDEIGDIAGEVQLADVENASFPNSICKVLVAAFQNAFAVRRDAEFSLFFQVKYSDSQTMVTIGGGLFAPEMATSISRRVKKLLPFLKVGEKKLYNIKSLHLTERERVLFDRAVTHKNRRSSERNTLLKLGFEEKDLVAYKDLIRYLPRYVETIV
ncbi:MAG: O-methyltransferase [Azonexus sp.]